MHLNCSVQQLTSNDQKILRENNLELGPPARIGVPAPPGVVVRDVQLTGGAVGYAFCYIAPTAEGLGDTIRYWKAVESTLSPIADGTWLQKIDVVVELSQCTVVVTSRAQPLSLWLAEEENAAEGFAGIFQKLSLAIAKLTQSGIRVGLLTLGDVLVEPSGDVVVAATSEFHWGREAHRGTYGHPVEIVIAYAMALGEALPHLMSQVMAFRSTALTIDRSLPLKMQLGRLVQLLGGELEIEQSPAQARPKHPWIYSKEHTRSKQKLSVMKVLTPLLVLVFGASGLLGASFLVESNENEASTLFPASVLTAPTPHGQEFLSAYIEEIPDGASESEGQKPTKNTERIETDASAAAGGQERKDAAKASASPTSAQVELVLEHRMELLAEVLRSKSSEQTQEVLERFDNVYLVDSTAHKNAVQYAMQLNLQGVRIEQQIVTVHSMEHTVFSETSRSNDPDPTSPDLPTSEAPRMTFEVDYSMSYAITGQGEGTLIEERENVILELVQVGALWLISGITPTNAQ